MSCAIGREYQELMWTQFSVKKIREKPTEKENLLRFDRKMVIIGLIDVSGVDKKPQK